MASPSHSSTSTAVTPAINFFDPDIMPDELVLHLITFLPADQATKLKSVSKRLKALVEHSFTFFSAALKANYLTLLTTRKAKLDKDFDAAQKVLIDQSNTVNKQTFQRLHLEFNHKFVEPRRSCQHEIGILNGRWADQTNALEPEVAARLTGKRFYYG